MAVPIRQVGQNLKTQRTQRELPQRTQRTARKGCRGVYLTGQIARYAKP